MNLSIVSPEALLFKGEVESITLPGTSGYFQILNNHAPLVSTLAAGKVKIEGKINLEEINIEKFEYKEYCSSYMKCEKMKKLHPESFNAFYE